MAEINVTDLTTQALNGTGAFDELMQSVSARLLEEYSKNRIKGADYSNVYLGAMTATMQQALTFVLERQTADKQAELLDSQKRLADKQVDGSELDNQIKEKQLLKIDAEIALINQQIEFSKQQELNLEKEYEKTTAEIALIEQNKANAAITATSLVKQQAKTEAETALLDQKKFTEQAQILDTVNGQAVTGVIGKQKSLYQKQTDGFDRDAEQKVAKLMTDAWSVQRSTDDAISPAGTGLEDQNIQNVLSKAITAIGANFNT